jgi:general secretion pathway protein C
MRLQLDARARRWLRRLPVVNLYSVAELALMTALAMQVARLLWAVATPVGPLGDWRPATVATPLSPIETLSGFDPFFRLSGAGVPGPATVTMLQLQLFGIRLDDATGRGSAILAGPDGVQKSVAVGEEVSPGVILKSVAFDHVTLDRGGASEDLFIDQSGGAAAAAPTGATSTPGAASAVAAPQGVTVGQIRQDIGFIPRIDGGRVTGLTVRSQSTGNAFRAAGLQDGDVLSAIGGRPVTGPADFDRVAREFAAGGNLPLTVERAGNPVQLAITIVPNE